MIIKMTNTLPENQYSSDFLKEFKQKEGIWEVVKIDDNNVWVTVKSDKSFSGHWDCYARSHEWIEVIEEVVLPKELFEI